MLSFFHDLYQDFCLKIFLKELMFPNSLYKRLDFIILTYSLKIFFFFPLTCFFYSFFYEFFFYDLFFSFFFFFWKFFSFLEICIRIFPLTCFFYSFFYEFFFYDLFFSFFFFFWKFFSFLEICIRIFGDFKKVVFLNSIYQELYFPFCILFFFCN